MDTFTDPLVDDAIPMSECERQVWDALNEHWQPRSARRGLPSWASAALDRSGEVVRNAAHAAAGAVPEVVKEPVRRAGDAVAGAALRPTFEAAAALLELVNAWALELNDPKGVEKLAANMALNSTVSSSCDSRTSGCATGS